ncbi:MAG TPA: glutamate racemase [Gammaproteobacteria bacterium]|nr:glutamate racemase [Gammaproteobacteria bacterium]
MLATQPIGIFDSGIGGLTVAKAIHQQLPNESIIYFGDTAHTPWGSQSASAIQHYASRISETLLEQKCKVIVVACNTASAAAYEAVKHVVKDHALLFNVIDPVIAHVVAKHQNKTIGLIGTKQTIKSGAYANRLSKLSDTINLQSLATPLLVPLIEEGFSNTDAARQIIEHYLTDPNMQNISALILGCTHYPLIKQQVSDFFAHKIEVLDSAQLISNVIAEQLDARNLRNPGNNAQLTFYVSHDSGFFNHTAQQFFPGAINLQTYPLWD